MMRQNKEWYCGKCHKFITYKHTHSTEWETCCDYCDTPVIHINTLDRIVTAYTFNTTYMLEFCDEIISKNTLQK